MGSDDDEPVFRHIDEDWDEKRDKEIRELNHEIDRGFLESGAYSAEDSPQDDRDAIERNVKRMNAWLQTAPSELIATHFARSCSEFAAAMSNDIWLDDPSRHTLERLSKLGIDHGETEVTVGQILRDVEEEWLGALEQDEPSRAINGLGVRKLIFRHLEEIVRVWKHRA